MAGDPDRAELYGHFVGGITPALEIVLDEAKAARRTTGVGVGVIVAASRVRHPLDARTLARLAARYAGDGPGTVVGFGLSNDERRGQTGRLRPRVRHRAPRGVGPGPARRRAARASRGPGDPVGPATRPDRARGAVGRGFRASSQEVADAGVTLEVCPGSNVALGVYAAAARCPCARSSHTAYRLPSAPTTRCCSAPGWSTSTPWPATCWGSTTAGWLQLARDAVAASRAPAAGARRGARDIERRLAVPALGRRPQGRPPGQRPG